MAKIEAWSVSEHQFPHEGTAEEKLIFCVRYAILAPSVYNTQPWQFEVKGNECRIFADRRYALSVIDPDDRSLIIACSAALFNLRVAISYFGYHSDIEFMPDSEQEDLLAKVTIGDEVEAENDEGGEKELFKSITEFEKNHGV
ncbi:MAG: nitroreductase, partial [Bdellovibrionales bacterium]